MGLRKNHRRAEAQRNKQLALVWVLGRMDL
jgi:hypothetical protein